jgi:hypothetical protein
LSELQANTVQKHCIRLNFNTRLFGQSLKPLNFHPQAADQNLRELVETAVVAIIGGADQKETACQAQ